MSATNLFIEDLEEDSDDQDVFEDCRETFSDDDEEDEDAFERLPEELIVKILSSLTQKEIALSIARINKRWKLSIIPRAFFLILRFWSGFMTYPKFPAFGKHFAFPVNGTTV